MELANQMAEARSAGVEPAAWDEAWSIYLRMLAPVAPHLAEELWHRRGEESSVHRASWPAVDTRAMEEDSFTLVVQVNGKLRDRLTLPVGTPEKVIRERALLAEGAAKFIEGKTVRKVIVVPGRLVNVVVA